MSSRRHFASSLFCICIEKRLLSSHCYLVITSVSGDWISSVRRLKCSLLVVELVKTTDMPKVDRPLQPAGHFIKSTLSLFHVRLKKETKIWCLNLQHQRRHKWTRYAPVCPVTHPLRLPCSRLYVSLSLCHPPLSSFSHFPLTSSPESTTTQPGKIARSHAAKQAYPWPWFPLTTFPSAAK